MTAATSPTLCSALLLLGLASSPESVLLVLLVGGAA